MTDAVSSRGKVGEFLGEKNNNNILIIFTPVMVEILHAHCNIIINVPMRKEGSAAGVWQIISFQTGKQSTVGRDWGLKKRFGPQLGFHLSADGGPSGPLCGGRGGGFSGISILLSPSRAPDSHGKEITFWGQPTRLSHLLHGVLILTTRSHYSLPLPWATFFWAVSMLFPPCRGAPAPPHNSCLVFKTHLGSFSNSAKEY